MSEHKVSGTFTGTGQSSSIGIFGGGNFALWGTFDATVVPECSYDGGTTWLPLSKDNAGADASYTAPCNLSFEEPEHDVLFRLNCTVFASGTVSYRISGHSS